MVLLNFGQLSLLVLTIFHLHSGRGQTDAKDISGFLLSGKTFSVRTIITRLANETGEKPKRIEESYSFEQRRAKIEIHDPVAGVEEFVHDENHGTKISYNRNTEECLDRSFDDLYDRFMLGSNKIKSILLRMKTVKHEHVVGPARLLYFLASKRDEVEVMPSKDVIGQVKIRNHKTTMLQLQISELSAVAFIFYDSTTFTDKESCLSQIPLKVSIEMTEDHEMIDLDFYDLRIDEAVTMTSVFPNRDDDIRWDPFVSPLARGCLKYIPESAEKNLMGLTFTATQLSFSAVSNNGNSYFVALQGPIEAIRVDTRMKDRSDTIKLIELRNNEKLTIMKDQHADAKRCFVTKAMVEERDRIRTDLSLSRMILGPERFVFMGRSIVRGVRALIYEAYPAPLPIWLSQPTIYRYKAGTEKARDRGYRVRDTNANTEQDKYSMLVYLADEAENATEQLWNRPLMIELYDTSGHQDSRRQLSLRIHNFMWELSEAPNGDKMYELFEYHEACLTRTGTSRYAEVEFSLVGNLFDATWIHELHSRQTAVAAVVRDAFDMQSFMTHDLKSQVTSTQKDAESDSTLQVSFRAVEKPQVTFEFIFNANARVKPSTELIDEGAIIKAQDPTDCLQLFEPGQTTGFVLFSEKFKTCVIDRKMEGSSHWTESQLFEVYPLYKDEYYQIQLVEVEDDKLPTQRLESKVRGLENRLVALRSPPLLKTHNQAIYNLPMKDIKLKAINYLQHVVADGKHLVGSIFQGFTLMDKSDQNTRFELSKEEAKDRLLSLNQCEAACLSDLDCKTFSYCSTWPDASCILSKTTLNSVNVARQLEEAKKQTQGSQLRVEVEDLGEIELKRDSRCELHNKFYLKLFHHSWPFTTSLEEAKVEAATDEEDCARRCFARSIEAIKSSVAHARKIDKITDPEELDAELKKQPMAHTSFVTDFCSTFLYLEGSLDEKQSELMKYYAEESDAYCIYLKRDQSVAEDTRVDLPDELKRLELELETYKFDMSTLFEKQSGVVMLDSEKNEQEVDAYRSFRHRPSSEDYDVFRQTALSGRNLQESFTYVDKELCAYRCFFQVSAPPLSCQSFDFIIWKDYSTVCNLNSLSISSVSRNLTETISREKYLQTYHFEPRFGLIKDKSDLDSRTSYWLDIDTYKLSQEEVAWIEASGEWLLVILAILVGVFVGLVVNKRLQTRRNRIGSLDRIVVPDLTNEASRTNNNELSIW